MSEFAGILTRRFISFRHLGFESSAHKLPEERESENPQIVAERGEEITVEIGETSTSPPKGSTSLQDAPVRAEFFGWFWDRQLTYLVRKVISSFIIYI